MFPDALEASPRESDGTVFGIHFVESKLMDVVSTINAAWSDAASLFERGIISSEATLQATLTSALLQSIDGCEVHCQVRCIEGSGRSLFPDLLIVRGAEVLAVLELKFCPEYVPQAHRIQADLDKLERYATSRTPFKVRMDPRIGQYAGQEFYFGRETIYGFGIVAPERIRVRCEAAVLAMTECKPLLLFMPSQR